MMVTVATFYLFAIFCIVLFMGGANANNSESCASSTIAIEKAESVVEIAKKALENLCFAWGGPGGGPGGPGGGPGGPGGFGGPGPGGPGGPGGGPGYGGPGPGYGPYYGGGYGGPYGGGGYIGPYGPWVGGPGAGGYGQYNPYYGPNGFGPTGNSAAGHGALPKVPERPEKYGFFQRLAAFFEHWFG